MGLCTCFEELGGEGVFVNVLAISIALEWHWIHVFIIPDPICIIISNVQLVQGEATWYKSPINFFFSMFLEHSDFIDLFLKKIKWIIPTMC